MKQSTKNCRMKERKLLQLYSLWQETRREDVQRECLGLLGEILRVKPHYNLRSQFDAAF